MRERGRLLKREREREGSERNTDVPKLYAYNEFEHSVKFLLITYVIQLI